MQVRGCGPFGSCLDAAEHLAGHDEVGRDDRQQVGGGDPPWPGSPCPSQSWAALPAVQDRDVLSPASSSSLLVFGASMTSCLVRPLTVYRLCLPSGPKHCRGRRASGPGSAVVIAVRAGRAFIIEDDAALALKILSRTREHAPVVPGYGSRVSD